MTHATRKTRREFLRIGAGAGAGAAALLAGCAGGGLGTGGAGAKPPNEDVLPAEDLMREHGLLLRVLLVYDECARRVEGGGELPRQSLTEAGGIVRRFVEDYHEKLEEEFVFPRVRAAGKLVELVDVLAAQHKAGRAVTEAILASADRGVATAEDRGHLLADIRRFVRMYIPHLSREDTVLFPAFHAMIPPGEYDQLGDRFEARERQVLGEEGFERMVDKVAGIERTLEIYDLAGFTPKV